MPRVAPRTLVRLGAPLEAVRATAIADLGATDTGDATLEVAPAPGTQPAITLELDLEADGDATVARITARGGVDIPFFGFFFVPLVAIARRRACTHTAAVLEAHLTNTAPPPPPGAVFGLPPVAFEHEQAALLATAAAATAVVAFAGALFGQLSGPISDSFHLSDTGLTAALALTRIGALVRARTHRAGRPARAPYLDPGRRARLVVRLCALGTRARHRVLHRRPGPPTRFAHHDRHRRRDRGRRGVARGRTRLRHVDARARGRPRLLVRRRGVALRRPRCQRLAHPLRARRRNRASRATDREATARDGALPKRLPRAPRCRVGGCERSSTVGTGAGSCCSPARRSLPTSSRHRRRN